MSICESCRFGYPEPNDDGYYCEARDDVFKIMLNCKFWACKLSRIGTRDEHKHTYDASYDPVPDEAHTCGECVRFTVNTCKEDSTKYCSSCYGPGNASENRKACRHYWDRAEEEERSKQIAEQNEAERQKRWEKNKENPPKPAVFKADWDEMSGKLTGEMPFCPNCNEPLYRNTSTSIKSRDKTFCFNDFSRFCCMVPK